MTVKPSFDDASSALWGVAGVAVAAGVLFWRYRTTTVPAAHEPAPVE